jgi:HTH-type transcriptional regulator / antitoxin HigA
MGKLWHFIVRPRRGEFQPEVAMTIATTTHRDAMPSTFADLCRTHPPRPINDEIDYEAAAAVVDRLATLKKRSRDQNDYLETLTILIERYDRDHLPAAELSDPIKRLKRLIENHGMSASDLGRILGNRALGPAILRRARKISKANAAALARHFKMSPAAFFQP